MLLRASIPLPLAGFGLELLESQSERSGVPLDSFIVRAAERYVAEVNRELPSSRVPRFLNESPPSVGERKLDVELEPELWSALEREAEAQGVQLELLVTHAAVWFAARLDS
jgi:hypothetical protein